MTARAKVISKYETKPVTELAVTVTNSDGELVLEDTAWYYTFFPNLEADT